MTAKTVPSEPVSRDPTRVSPVKSDAETSAAPAVDFSASAFPLGTALSVHSILEMQRVVGNQAIQRLIANKRANPGNTIASAPAGDANPRMSSFKITVQRRPKSSTSSAAPRSLADIEKNYRDIIAGARGKGYNVAADNLKYWLDGGGGKRSMDVAWLRGYGPVTSAETKNQGRFEKQLKQQAERLPDGGTENFSDHWDAALTAWQGTELYYASGTSELSSKGTFALVRTGRTVTITGSVMQHWHDPYNWNAGQSAYIPGVGTISDDDALALKAAGTGVDYELISDWVQTVQGAADIGRIYNSIDLKWSGP